MSLGGLSLLFIGAVLLHNTEEALRLPRWSTRGLSWYPRLTRRPFVFAVCVLSLVLIACAAAAAWAGPDSVAAYLFVGYAFAMAANAVVPHLVGSLAARSLMPGTWFGSDGACFFPCLLLVGHLRLEPSALLLHLSLLAENDFAAGP